LSVARALICRYTVWGHDLRLVREGPSLDIP
jgi:hypothetical protein